MIDFKARNKKEIISQFIEHFELKTLNKMLFDLIIYRDSFPKGDKDIDLKIECLQEKLEQIFDQEQNL